MIRYIIVIVLLTVSPAFPAVVGDPLSIGQVVTLDPSSPCFNCSPSGRYVVSALFSNTTTFIGITSYSALNYFSNLKLKVVSDSVDYIDVYRYVGAELPISYTPAVYPPCSFLISRYKVHPLEYVLSTPSQDLSGLSNASRLSVIQGRMSTSNQQLSMVYQNISSVRSQTSDSGSLSKMVSFFVGSLSAGAFVMAVRRKK